MEVLLTSQPSWSSAMLKSRRALLHVTTFQYILNCNMRLYCTNYCWKIVILAKELEAGDAE